MQARHFSIALPLALIALASLVIYGQNITGSILGQVADPSGSAVPGVTITLRNTNTGTTAETSTDASGSYSVPNLLAGTYEITIRKPGFQTATVRALQLLSARNPPAHLHRATLVELSHGPASAGAPRFYCAQGSRVKRDRR